MSLLKILETDIVKFATGAEGRTLGIKISTIDAALAAVDANHDGVITISEAIEAIVKAEQILLS